MKVSTGLLCIGECERVDKCLGGIGDGKQLIVFAETIGKTGKSNDVKLALKACSMAKVLGNKKAAIVYLLVIARQQAQKQNKGRAFLHLTKKEGFDREDAERLTLAEEAFTRAEYFLAVEHLEETLYFAQCIQAHARDLLAGAKRYAQRAAHAGEFQQTYYLVAFGMLAAAVKKADFDALYQLGRLWMGYSFEGLKIEENYEEAYLFLSLCTPLQDRNIRVLQERACALWQMQKLLGKNSS